MTEWLNASVLISSALGSLIAGVLLLTAKPVWWKWVNTEAVSMGIKAWLPLIVFFLLLFAIGSCINYVERSKPSPFHPSLTKEEAAAARSECRMKAIEATAAMDIYQRDRATRQYYDACLASKGFEWNEPQAISP